MCFIFLSLLLIIIWVSCTQARECFKAFDQAGLRAPFPLSYSKVGDVDRSLARSLSIVRTICSMDMREAIPGSN